MLHLVPRFVACGYFLHICLCPTVGCNHQAKARAVAHTLGKPVDFGCAGVPSRWPHLFHAVPVTQRHIIKFPFG